MSKYTDADVERGLRELVLADGRISKAVDRLAAAGEEIPDRTLREWRNVHADRFAELEATRRDWTAEEMAAASEFIAAGYAEGEAKMLANLLARPDEELKKLSPNVLAQAARNLSIARGVSIDKANDLRQRPTRPDGNTMDPMRALAVILEKFAHVVPEAKRLQAIDADAEEIK